MQDPKIKTKVVHSQSKDAWNVISAKLGSKYKIARIPYVPAEKPDLRDRQRVEAFELANFISFCFNNSEKICEKIK